jgi:hypothetical protein
VDVSTSAYDQRTNARRSRLAVGDERMLARIRELHAANDYAYGYRRMWTIAARATVEPRAARVRLPDGARRRVVGPVPRLVCVRSAGHATAGSGTVAGA